MMGIYISGMEMPTEKEGVAVIIYPDGTTVVEPFDIGFSQYCEAIPVPDHGRLVDADVYKAEMKKRQDAAAKWRDDIKNGGGCDTELYYRADSALAGFIEAKLTLDKIPTVIPSDRKGDS